MAANRYIILSTAIKCKLQFPVLIYAASKALQWVVSAVAMFYIEVDID